MRQTDEDGRLLHENVAEIQRARIVSAMAEVCRERGASNVSVAHVVGRAGVSRRTFYELFSDRDDCFLAAFDDAVERIGALVMPAWRGDGSWRERIRGSLVALLSFLDYDPGMGRLVIVESLGAGRSALERRGHVLAQVIAAVDAGRGEAKSASDAQPVAAEGAVGAVLSVLYARLSEERPGRLVELTNPLMSMIVLPYLGSAAARRELTRPVPKPDTAVSRSPSMSDPLRELNMRLTYRTVRVLVAIGAHPGASNRAVGRQAGIDDQGQISKLLARLARLGLVENGGGVARGAANAWRLTTRGVELERAIGESARRSSVGKAGGRVTAVPSSPGAGRRR